MNRYRKPCNSCQQPQVSPQQTEWFQPPFEPIVCPPRYRVHDSFIPRMQPVIHPTVNVNREHVFPVPQHFFPQVTRNEVCKSRTSTSDTLYEPISARCFSTTTVSANNNNFSLVNDNF